MNKKKIIIRALEKRLNDARNCAIDSHNAYCMENQGTGCGHNDIADKIKEMEEREIAMIEKYERRLSKYKN